MADALKKGPPPAGMAAVAIGPVSYTRLLHWAIIVVRGAPGLFLGSLVLGIIPLVLGQYTVRLLARIISLIGAAQPADSGVIRLVVLYALISLLVIALQFSARMQTIRSNAAMLGALQQRLHDRLLTMPSGFHDTHDLGETTTIVMQDAAGCQPMLSDLIAFPVTQGIALVSAVYFLVQSLGDLRSVPLGAQIALALVLVVLPPIGWRLSTRQRQAYDAVRGAQAALASEFANSATAPLEVRLLGAEAQRSRAFAHRLRALLGLRIEAQTGSEISNQFQIAVPTLLQTGFLAYAAVAAARAGAAAAGAILSIYYFVPKVIEPIDQIIRFLGGLQMLWVQATRMGAILDAPEPRVPASAPVSEHPARIVFDRVELTYPGARLPVLRGISHAFPAGKVTAIVGRAGCGKSSILALIDGLRSPLAGGITIDDKPINSMDVRQVVSVVSQSPLFITDTVRANFLLARADATDAEIETAARTAGLWPALVKLGGDGPLDVEVPRTPGHGLSGGERRLLAVARALLRRSSVLLLDEPTTGVDAVGIGVLLDGLRQACVGRTVILVEHNLDFVQSLADQICCLQDGRFTDIGTPAELAAQPSLFSELLAARQRLTSTAGLELAAVPLPVIAAGDADPWAGEKTMLPQGGPPKRDAPPDAIFAGAMRPTTA